MLSLLTSQFQISVTFLKVNKNRMSVFYCYALGVEDLDDILVLFLVCVCM